MRGVCGGGLAHSRPDQPSACRVGTHQTCLRPAILRRVIHPVKPDLIKVSTGAAAGAARVSLDDCLACSGCVTTAEAVLVQQQSVEEFQAAVHSGAYSRVVVLLSPQTIASAATHWAGESGRPEALGIVYRRLAAFFLARGATDVVDTGSAADVALREAAAELVFRVRSGVWGTGGPPRRRPKWEAPASTVAVTDGRILVTPASISSGEEARAAAAVPVVSTLAPIHAATAAAASAGEVPMVEVRASVSESRPTRLPVLSAECPGWVCYAEKTCPQALPFMSTAKSAQQVAGAVIKRVLAGRLSPGAGQTAPDIGQAASSAEAAGMPSSRARTGLAPSDILVCAVMPCFDKKLEASRKDFVDDVTRSKDVDLVLSTGEVMDWVEKEGLASGSLIEPAELDLDCGSDPLASLRSLADNGVAMLAESPELSGSGGYAAAVARSAAKDLWGLSAAQALGLELTFEQGRNPDISTATLRRPENESGAALQVSPSTADVPNELVFVRAYGFRNVQGVVNRLRRGKSAAHYVEVMACPGGCANGGGQARPPATTSKEAKDLIRDKERVQERAGFVSMALAGRERRSKGRLSELVYASVAPDGAGSHEAVELLHTRFHAVPKMPGTSGIKW